MRRLGPNARTAVAVAIVIATVIATFVGLGRAADVKASFRLTLSPKPVVTVGAQSLATLAFDYNGPTPTRINKASVSVDLPAGAVYNDALSSDGCSLSGVRVTCEIGTVFASDPLAKRYVVFNAPTTAQENLVVKGFAAWNEGPNDGTPASHLDTVPDDDVFDVRVSGHSNGAGKCEGAATLSTPPPTNTDPQSTAATYGTTTGGEPCTAVSVGEEPVGGLTCGTKSCTSQVSFVTLPQLSGLAQAVVTALSLPRGTTSDTVAFFELRDFPEVVAVTNPIVPCGTGGAMPDGEDTCLLTRAKFKGGGQFTFLMKGLGRDPGVVF